MLFKQLCSVNTMSPTVKLQLKRQVRDGNIFSAMHKGIFIIKEWTSLGHHVLVFISTRKIRYFKLCMTDFADLLL